MSLGTRQVDSETWNSSSRVPLSLRGSSLMRSSVRRRADETMGLSCRSRGLSGMKALASASAAIHASAGRAIAMQQQCGSRLEAACSLLLLVPYRPLARLYNRVALSSAARILAIVNETSQPRDSATRTMHATTS